MWVGAYVLLSNCHSGEMTFHLYMHVARGQGRKLALHITSGSQELGALIGGPGTGVINYTQIKAISPQQLKAGSGA